MSTPPVLAGIAFGNPSEDGGRQNNKSIILYGQTLINLKSSGSGVSTFVWIYSLIFITKMICAKISTKMKGFAVADNHQICIFAFPKKS
jgi:hypothetical protein